METAQRTLSAEGEKISGGRVPSDRRPTSVPDPPNFVRQPGLKSQTHQLLSWLSRVPASAKAFWVNHDCTPDNSPCVPPAPQLARKCGCLC